MKTIICSMLCLLMTISAYSKNVQRNIKQVEESYKPNYVCPQGTIDLFPRLRDKYTTYEFLKDVSLQTKKYENIVVNARRFHDQSDQEHREYAEYFEAMIKPYIQRMPSLRYLGNLNEEFQVVKTDKEKKNIIKQMKRTVQNVLASYRMTMRELSQDPFLDEYPQLKPKVDSWLKEFGTEDRDSLEFDSCFGRRMSTFNWEQGKNKLSSEDQQLLNGMKELKQNTKTLIGRTNILKYCLGKAPLVGKGDFDFGKSILKFGLRHPGHPISMTGFIEGNKVTYHHENPWDADSFRWVEQHIGLFEKYKYSSVYQFKELIRQEKKTGKKIIFEEPDSKDQPGFPTAENHPMFQRGIFKTLLDGIRSTSRGGEKTIFIDIFFLGQTIGVVMAKELIKALESNPQLKVFILRDDVNHYGHAKEMVPVYNYLRAYSELQLENRSQKARLIILPADLDQHPTGLADWMNWFIPNNGQEVIGKKLPLSLMAKSDHSKVMVINGKNINGEAEAYVASKNWLDMSGGITFDELIKIKGPAATVIQDNYVPDMIEALVREQQRDYLVRLYLDQFPGAQLPVVQGVDPFVGGNTLKSMVYKMATEIVADWDVINRKDDLTGDFLEHGLCAQMIGEQRNKNGRVVYGSIVSIGENNVDSMIKSALDQDLYLIANSTQKVRIADQFLAEARLVKVVIDATKRETNPIDVDILLTSIPAVDPMPANFPNVLYLEPLLTESASGRLNYHYKKLYHSSHMAQEFHKKTVTGGTHNWDVHISGSANKGLMTMRGAFRETQVMIIEPSTDSNTVAKQAIRVFEKDFKINPESEDSLVYLEDIPSRKDYEASIDGAVKATLDYQLPSNGKGESLMKALKPIINLEVYQFMDWMRETIEAVFDPYTFSLGEMKREGSTNRKK